MPLALILLAFLAAAPKKAVKESPPRTPVTEAAIVRKHQPGQRYSVALNSSEAEQGSSKFFKGIATVKTVAPDEVTLNVELSELTWSGHGAPKRKARGVVLNVTIVRRSIDAQVASPGSAGDAAEMELTAFEMLLGDLCQPPSELLTVGKTLNQWTLVEIKGDLAHLKSAPVKGGDPFECDTTVSLTDGFAGERKGTMRVDLGQVDPKTHQPMTIEQKYTLNVKRL